ncbi:MAG: small basic protein [Phycisphaeraceae bacterium]|nr:MAG: small basic protein [Phycisphaeraceae bacterium]
MSLDSSLKTGGNLVAKRSVLKRHERLVLLKKHKDYDEKSKPVIGLPKTDARTA